MKIITFPSTRNIAKTQNASLSSTNKTSTQLLTEAFNALKKFEEKPLKHSYR